jgi:hypothetical protein
LALRGLKMGGGALLACGAVGIFAYKNRKGKTNLTEVDAPTDEESSHASEGLEKHE